MVVYTVFPHFIMCNLCTFKCKLNIGNAKPVTVVKQFSNTPLGFTLLG